MIGSLYLWLAQLNEHWKHRHRKSWININRLINQLLKLSYFRHLTLSYTSGSLATLRPRIPKGLDLIRIGGQGDGGYLVPNTFEEIRAVFSPGVDQESSFELYFAELGLPVFLADGSINSPPVDHKNFYFQRKFLGSANNDQFLTLESWVKSSRLDIQGLTDRNCPQSADLILQMDIEGYEFDALLATPKKVLESFRIIVLELHYINFMLELNPPLEAIIQACALRKLAQTHYCCHVHPNNCCGEITHQGYRVPRIAEVTLLNRKYYGDTVRNVNTFPNHLDRACVNTKKELVLDSFWNISQ